MTFTGPADVRVDVKHEKRADVTTGQLRDLLAVVTPDA